MTDLTLSHTTLTEDVAANGPFLMAYWGSQLAIGFRGRDDYINRCFNWAYNMGVTNGSLHQPFDHDGGLRYIVVRERRDADGKLVKKSQDYLREGLMLQFSLEIMMAKEVAALPDGSDDEVEISRRAAIRLDDFMANHMVSVNFLRRFPSSLAPIYETVDASGGSSGEED